MADIGPLGFDTPEFQELLKKYERMKERNKHVFFDSDELVSLIEYYASRHETENFEGVIDYGLQLYPDNLDIVVYRCHALMARGQYFEAEQIIDKLPDSGDYSARLIKAEICLNKGNYEEGHKILDALYNEEQDIDMILDIAQIYLNVCLLDNAYEWLEKAYEKCPDNRDVLEMFANYYFRTDNTEKEIEFNNKILDKDPYNAYAWQQLSRCYIKLEQPEKALEAAGFAGVIDESDQRTMELEGVSNIMLHNMETAIAKLEEAKENSRNRNYINSLLLNCYMLECDYDKVMEYSNMLLDDPETQDYQKAEIYSRRAAAYLEFNMMGKCKEDIAKGFTYDHYNSGLFQLEGEVYIREARVLRANESFKKAIEYAEFKGDVIVTVTQTYLNYDWWDEAGILLQELETECPSVLRENAYFVAYSYFLMKLKKKVAQFLVMAAVYSPEIFLNDEKNEFRHIDRRFFDLSKQIFEKVRNNEVNTEDFLTMKGFGY